MLDGVQRKAIHFIWRSYNHFSRTMALKLLNIVPLHFRYRMKALKLLYTVIKSSTTILGGNNIEYMADTCTCSSHSWKMKPLFTRTNTFNFRFYFHIEQTFGIPCRVIFVHCH